MQLLIDVYDASGNRLGAGPITTCTAATVTRTLDGAGSLALDFPASDARVQSLLTNKVRCHVFVDDGDSLRELGRLIVEKSGLQQDASSLIRTVDGPDNLGELRFKTVRRGRKYDAATVNTIVDSLLGLVSGWVRSGSVTNTVSARFDGASVLKSLVELVRQQGVHFRQASTFGTLEIGAFGTDNGLIVENFASYGGDAPDHVLLIESLTLLEDSEELINWLEPIGAGDGDAAITLEKAASTRSIALGFAYDIDTETGPDGRTVYYLQDATSQAAYGTVEKTGAFKDITLVGTAEADQVAAAEALYDVAAATLARFKDPYKSYRLTARKPKQNILPGDKIRLRDEFSVYDLDGVLVDVVNLDAYFWVMQVTETLGSNGHAMQLQIANIDRHAVDEAEIVVGAIEDIRLANVSVKPYFSKDSFIDAFEIDSTHDVTFEINITARTQAVNKATLRIVTTPFRATANGAASGGGSTSGSGGGQTSSGGGDHRHRMAVYTGNASGGTSREYLVRDSGLNSFNFYVPTNQASDMYTYDASGTHTHTVNDHTHTVPAHTHPISYGISDDTDYPDHVSVTVNGTSVATDLDTAGTGLDTELDITAEILAAASVQQAHSVVISCTGGQGRVKVFVELYETIQSVSVFA